LGQPARPGRLIVEAPVGEEFCVLLDGEMYLTERPGVPVRTARIGCFAFSLQVRARGLPGAAYSSDNTRYTASGAITRSTARATISGSVRGEPSVAVCEMNDDTRP
jgi:hypothetical protein